MLARSDVDEYIDNNYGTCDRKALCHCMRTGTPNHAGCPYWTPVSGADREWLLKVFASANDRKKDGFAI